MGDVGHDKIGALNDVLDYPAVVRKLGVIERDIAIAVMCAGISDKTKCCF